MAATNVSADDTSVLPYALVASTTAGATSGAFIVPENGSATVFAVGLAGAEEVNLQMLQADGSTWSTVLGSGFPLDATGTVASITAKGRYKVVQDATTGATTTQIYGESFQRRAR